MRREMALVFGFNAVEKTDTPVQIAFTKFNTRLATDYPWLETIARFLISNPLRNHAPRLCLSRPHAAQENTNIEAATTANPP
jgi:hypothetical protein